MTKHPNIKFRKLVKDVRNLKKKKEIYEPQENRKIDWTKYTLSKINDLKEISIFIREAVNEIRVKKVPKIGRPQSIPNI